MPRPQYEMQIAEDEPIEDYEGTGMDESRGPLEESGCTRSDDSEEEVEDAEDIARFEESFRNINKRYRLINRIGEGTFSTVYKAEDLLYDHYHNDWDIDARLATRWSSPSGHPHRRRQARYVAIKKIYVTSSPLRILNELELLHDLRASDSVCPLITAFRHADQVVAILPYFQHRDFRDYFRDMTVGDMRLYFRSLFTALRAVHANGILHRDIKPTNFLYSPQHSRGVLVDFGLAEREGTDWHFCDCNLPPGDRRVKIENSVYAYNLVNNANQPPSFPNPKTDQRPSRRANRAGTRGFRAPEVLLKCTSQTVAIDMWSAGVILLTLLSRRFPFFHSADDIDALLELTAIFGKRRMRETALLHGQAFETNIPSYSENGHGFEKIVVWCTNRKREALGEDEREACAFLERLLECDASRRITAEEALAHPFIASAGVGSGGDEEVDMVDLRVE